ncbi:MAG: hypothetical protein RLZ23_68, partial [Actinomycetota bacterium]
TGGNNGREWCKKGESGVKWGIERDFTLNDLGEGGDNDVSWNS